MDREVTYSDNFEKGIKTGRIALYSFDLFEKVVDDVEVFIPFESDTDEVKEEKKNMEFIVNVLISQKLKKENYLLWQLRKRGLTFQQIADYFGLKAHSVVERYYRVKKTVEEIESNIFNYYALNAELQNIYLEIKDKR